MKQGSEPFLATRQFSLERFHVGHHDRHCGKKSEYRADEESPWGKPGHRAQEGVVEVVEAPQDHGASGNSPADALAARLADEDQAVEYLA